MSSNAYVALSAQLALSRRLDTLANNMANATTAGFRAEKVDFAQLISRSADTPVSFASRGETHLSTAPGELTETGNPLDVAIRGSSWFSVQTPSGFAYSRDGRMQMTETGELKSLSGHPILDAGGAPLQINPSAGPPTIAKDGTITQGNQQVGAIGLYSMDPSTKFTRADGATVVPDITPVPELDFNSNGIAQGFVEKSNVNPVSELTKLIAVQRAFDAVSNMLKDTENSMLDAIKVLSGA